VPVDSNSTAPAGIGFVMPDGTLTVDGAHAAGGENYGDAAPGEFFIAGNWTSRTQMEVSRKLSRLILKGIDGGEPFEKEARIVVNIDERANIDATTAASIAGILAKELKEYGYITFVTNREKGFQLKNSPGFSLIQKKVRIKG
jgi:hypothetical protein